MEKRTPSLYGITTGYFGVPGRVGGLVHLVRDGKPICGSRLDARAEYQFCTNRIALDMVECRRCKKEHAKLVKKDASAASKPASYARKTSAGLLSAYRKGRQAYHDGKPCENPYAERLTRHHFRRFWYEGYDDARNGWMERYFANR